MGTCRLCGRPEEDDIYCPGCEKILGDVQADLKAELMG